MLNKKQNGFDDFHAATEWLIWNKYANKDRVAIRGGSNGGVNLFFKATLRLN